MPEDLKKTSRKPLPEKQQEVVEEHLPLRSPMVYEVVRQEGEIELGRPLASLWWSGVAAGIAMYSSLLALGVLNEHLPDEPWKPLVANFGYCFGFIIVVLGRLQLFTENTITAVLPLLLLHGKIGMGHALGVLLPTLAGNIIGGTGLFALLAYAQIREEI
jgi:formate/nitrite transporter FocA (FNT family)